MLVLPKYALSLLFLENLVFVEIHAILKLNLVQKVILVTVLKKGLTELMLAGVLLTATTGTYVRTPVVKTQAATNFNTDHLDPQKKQFLDAIIPTALQLSQEYNLFPSVMVAQAALESGWGSSSLASQYNNLFGVKGSYQGDSINLPTQENYGNGLIGVNAGFRAYPSWNESLQDYAQLLAQGIAGNSEFYAPVWRSNCRTYQDATRYLQGTYATDTNYTNSLNNLIATYGLAALDNMSGDNLLANNLNPSPTAAHLITRPHSVFQNLTIQPLTLTVNSKKPDLTDFKITANNDRGNQMLKNLTVNTAAINCNKTGVYDAKLMYQGQELTVPVTVIDNIDAHNTTIDNVLVQQGNTNFNKYQVIKNLGSDFVNTGVKDVQINGEVDVNTPGTYPLDIKINHNGLALDHRTVQVQVVAQMPTNNHPQLDSYNHLINSQDTTSLTHLQKVLQVQAHDFQGQPITDYHLKNFQGQNLQTPGLKTVILYLRDTFGNETVQTLSFTVNPQPHTLTVMRGEKLNLQQVFQDPGLPTLTEFSKNGTFMYQGQQSRYQVQVRTNPEAFQIQPQNTSITNTIKPQDFLTTNNTNAISIRTPKKWHVGKNNLWYQINRQSVKVPLYLTADKPTIYGNTINVTAGSVLGVNRFLAADSKAAGDLSSKIQIDNAPLNLKKAGNYQTQATVTDQFGNTTTKTVQVHVSANKPHVNLPFNTPTIKTAADLQAVLQQVSAVDSVDGNLTQQLHFDTQQVNFEHKNTYPVSYQVTNSNGETVRGHFLVAVSDIKKGQTVSSGKPSQVNYRPQITQPQQVRNQQELVPTGTESFGEPFNYHLQPTAVDYQNTPTN